MKTTTLIFLGLSLVSIAGCIATSPNWDERFGEATANIRAQQTRTAGAGAQHPAPDGLDGPSANAAVDQYQRSFKAPAPAANVFSIGVGSTQP